MFKIFHLTTSLFSNTPLLIPTVMANIDRTLMPERHIGMPYKYWFNNRKIRAYDDINWLIADHLHNLPEQYRVRQS